MKETISNLKTNLLGVYSNHFEKLAIWSNPTITVQKEHLTAVHIYLKVLAYYQEAVDRGVEERITITNLDAERMLFEIKKSLQLANTVYYE